MCFIVKYVLFIANLIFTLAGITLIGLGSAILIKSAELRDLMPIAIEAIPISVITLGALIFLLAFFGCCGSIKENRCLLLLYSLSMVLLAAGKIYLSVVIFNSVNRMAELVEDWIGQAFNNNNLRQPFHAMEAVFRCCGTTGSDSYTGGVLPELPLTCCPNPNEIQVCERENAFTGCNGIVTEFLATYGEVVGGLIVTIIIIELVAMAFGFILCCWIGNKRSRTL